MRFEAAFVLLVLALLGLEAWVVLRVRRVQPPPPPPPPPPLVTHCLLSYPRSGNHWMRYILEALTDRPTVGCGPADKPIHTNSFDHQPVLPRVKATALPIANKFHFVAPKRKGCTTFEMPCKSLIFIIRNPHEALPRNIGRSKPWNVKEVKQSVEHYESLIRFFLEFGGPKLLVRYEDLIENAKPTIATIADFVHASKEALDRFHNRFEEHVRMSKEANGKSWYGSVSNSTTFHWNLIGAQKQSMLDNALGGSLWYRL